MKSILKIIWFSLILFLCSVVNGQGIDARLEIEHNDSLKITLTLKNTGTLPVKLRLANGLRAQYSYFEDYSWSHCFRVSETGSNYDSYRKERTPEAFVILNPGEELISKGYCYIGWLCRGAPPARPWRFKVYYDREITQEDNYFNFTSYYTGLVERIPVEDAWTGTITSNKIDVVINNKN